MSARNRADALRDHRQELQRKLSCVTIGVLSTGEPRFNSPAQPVGLYLNNNHPVPLSAPAPVALSVGQKPRIDRVEDSRRSRVQVSVVGYFYALELPTGEKIVSYQWDPEGSSRVNHLLLHIGHGATGNVTTFGPRGLHRIHFPTKHIELEDVLLLAITEFGVQPRRDDWEAIMRGDRT